MPELEANHAVRNQAIVRRFKGATESTIRIGKLVVNFRTRLVSVNDHAVPLTGKEYAIELWPEVGDGVTG